MPSRSSARASQLADQVFAALEPRQLLAADLESIKVDDLYDYTRTVPAVLSGPDVAAFGFGTSLATLGDLNGDGVDEFAVTAPGVKPSPLAAFAAPGPGRVFVFSGADLSLLRTLTDGVVGFGASIANVGDVNADGFADLAIGSPNADATDNGVTERHGRVRIYSGADASVLRTFTGTNPFAELGYSLAAGGDINTDGVSELIVGAPGDGPDAASAGPGRAMVFSLADGSTIYTFTGENTGDRFGHAVAGNADLLLFDDHPDFVVGAPSFDAPGAQDVGRAYAYSGADGELVGSLDLLPVARVAGARTGSAVSINDEDILVGAPGANEQVGIVASYGYNDSQHSMYLIYQFDGTPLAGARYGEAFVSADPAMDDSATYAAQPGVAHTPLLQVHGRHYRTDQLPEFTAATSFAWSNDLLVVAFANGSLAVAPSAMAVNNLRSWSPNRTFGVIAASSLIMPVTLRGADVYAFPALAGLSLMRVGDSGAVIALAFDQGGTQYESLDSYRFVKGDTATPLRDLIKSTVGTPLTGPLYVTAVLSDDDVLFYTEAGESYRLDVDTGVLRHLGRGRVINANDSGLTVAATADGSYATILWTADGAEVRLDGFTPLGSTVVNDDGYVLLRTTNKQIHLWKDGQTRLLHTLTENNVSGEISNVNTVIVRGVTPGQSPPFGRPPSVPPAPLSYTSLLLSIDGDVIADLEPIERAQPYTRALTLGADGVLSDYNTLFFVEGSGSLAHPNTTLASTIADGGRPAVSASLTVGLGLFGFEPGRPEGARVTIDSGAGFVRSSVVYTDTRDGRSYIVANIGGTLFWYSQIEGSGGRFDRGRILDHASESPIRGALTTFTSVDGRVHIVAQTFSNELILVFQTNAADPSDPANWSIVNLTADHLDPQGFDTPAFIGGMSAYVTRWGGMNIAGLDAAGDVRVVWWAPGLTYWQSDNLSDAAGADQPFVGNIATYLTAWDGINIAGTNADGTPLVLWWVPGAKWTFEGFGVESPALRPGSLTAYVTPWNGLNVAGIAADTGKVSTLWWTPGAQDVWTAEGIEPWGQSSLKFGDVLTSVVDAKTGAMNIFAVTEDNAVTRLLWTPEVQVWTPGVVA